MDPASRPAAKLLGSPRERLTDQQKAAAKAHMLQLTGQSLVRALLAKKYELRTGKGGWRAYSKFHGGKLVKKPKIRPNRARIYFRAPDGSFRLVNGTGSLT